MQTANEHEQGPVFLGCGVVGKVQYSGFTRFLQVDTATLEHLSQPNMQVILNSKRNYSSERMPVARPKCTITLRGHKT